jgi:hypothetical protein
LGDNFARIIPFTTYTLELQTPRSQVVYRVMTDMPAEYPWMPLIGIGSGQFSSRAGLIGSGMYFGGPAHPLPLPLIEGAMSKPFRDYVLPLWLRMAFQPQVNDSSAIYKPFLSWLSVYVEWGAIGVMLLLGMIIRLLWQLKRYTQIRALRLQAFAIAAGILFIFLSGATENYWEVSQALLVGLMLLKVQYANLRYGLQTSP